MILYMVMKLLTEIEYVEPITNQTKSVKLSGCEGYIPVFKTLKEAKKQSQKNKYQIAAIKT